MYVRHAVGMAVEIIFISVQRCSSRGMSRFHIEKRAMSGSVLTYVCRPWNKNNVFNVVNTASIGHT